LAAGEELYDSTEDLSFFANEPSPEVLSARQAALRQRFSARCAK
jgi:hypothetical protein